MRSEIVIVKLSDIDPNPHTDKKKYRTRKRRLEPLVRSIKEMDGLWEGVIGRRKHNRVQIAIGWKRVEAARLAGLDHIQVIIRDLTDEQMLQMLSRKTIEDYNVEFTDQMEVWEGAEKFCLRVGKMPHQIDKARFLGWVNADGKATAAARACDGALKLIAGGHLEIADLEGLSVTAAGQVVDRVLSRHEMIDKLGKMGGRPAKEIETHKRQVTDAGRSVARDYKEGNVANRNIKTEIDYRAVKDATKEQKATPIFAMFAREVADRIHKMMVDDWVAERLIEVEKALPLMSMEEDKLALRRIDFALAEHEETTGKWRHRLVAEKGKKVVPFKLLKSEDRK